MSVSIMETGNKRFVMKPLWFVPMISPFIKYTFDIVCYETCHDHNDV